MWNWPTRGLYPLVNVYITRENHYLLWVNQLWMAIFNSYVSLPEGTQHVLWQADHWGFSQHNLGYNQESTGILPKSHRTQLDLRTLNLDGIKDLIYCWWVCFFIYKAIHFYTHIIYIHIYIIYTRYIHTYICTYNIHICRGSCRPPLPTGRPWAQSNGQCILRPPQMTTERDTRPGQLSHTRWCPIVS